MRAHFKTIAEAAKCTPEDVYRVYCTGHARHAVKVAEAAHRLGLPLPTEERFRRIREEYDAEYQNDFRITYREGHRERAAGAQTRTPRELAVQDGFIRPMMGEAQLHRQARIELLRELGHKPRARGRKGEP